MLRRPIYQYLLGINGAVYLAWQTNIINKKFMLKHFTINKNSGRIFQLHNFITQAFSHFKFTHLLNNMFTLFFFGKITELIFGPNTIFYLYLLGGLTGGYISYKSDIQKKNYQFSLGASSACFALLTFFILNFPLSKIYIYGLIGIPAWALGTFLFLQSSL